MILYLDASSLVAIYLREHRRYEVVAEWRERADWVAMSVATYAEARAAFARALRSTSREPSLTPDDYAIAVEEIDIDWPAYAHVNCDEALIQQAGENAARYALRGYDAVHLTSALMLRTARTDEIHFSTWDRALADAAVSAGLSLAHEVNA